MSDLDRPIGRVWRRMRFQRFLSTLVWSLAATLLALAVTLAVAKLTHRVLPGPDWGPFSMAVGVALLAAAAVACGGGPSRVDAAVAIDRAFHLNERLSTALTLSDEWRDTPAGRALLEDAVKHVVDLDVRPAFGPRLPRLAWLPLVPACLALGLVFAPEISQRVVEARSTEQKLDKKLVTEQAKALTKKIASQRQELDKTKFPEADKLLAQIEKATDDLSKAPPAKKDKALVELNKLSDALKDRQKALGSPEQINRQLQQLKDMANSGPAEEFAKNLSRGDFTKAAQELKTLTEKLKAGKLSEGEKKALKEQLGEMSKQLQKLANLEERKKQLDEALKNGGLSKQQHEQEMAKLDEQAKGLKKLQQMSKQLAQAQEAMQKGDMKKAAEALGMTQQQVGEMAKNLQELESLDGAMAELQDTKNGMAADGMNQMGEAPDGFGNGFGQKGRNSGRGLGRGRGQGDRPEAPDQTAMYKTKVRQQLTKGKAFADGTAPSNTPVKGEAKIEIQAEIEAAQGNAADALINQKIPANLQKHVRGYFDQINKGK